MNILSKSFWISGVIAATFIFSNCNNPKYPDPIPHPEADPKKSTQPENEITANSDCTITTNKENTAIKIAPPVESAE